MALGVLGFSVAAQAENLSWRLYGNYQIDYIEGENGGSQPNNYGNAWNEDDYGNARIFRDYGNTGQSVKATAWSNTGSGGSFQTAYLGRWDNYGIGVNNRYDSGSNSHTVDNSGALDFVMFEFETSMAMNAAMLSVFSCGCYNGLDSDISIWVGDIDDAFTGNVDLTGLDFDDLEDTLGLTRLADNNDNSGASFRTANFNPGGIEGNTLIIATSINNPDSNTDKVKIKKLFGSPGEPGTSVPAPGGLMILALGLVAVGFMRRSQTAGLQA
jgi:hypothetical protein